MISDHIFTPLCSRSLHNVRTNNSIPFLFATTLNIWHSFYSMLQSVGTNNLIISRLQSLSFVQSCCRVFSQTLQFDSFPLICTWLPALCVHKRFILVDNFVFPNGRYYWSGIPSCSLCHHWSVNVFDIRMPAARHRQPLFTRPKARWRRCWLAK